MKVLMQIFLMYMVYSYLFGGRGGRGGRDDRGRAGTKGRVPAKGAPRQGGARRVGRGHDPEAHHVCHW